MLDAAQALKALLEAVELPGVSAQENGFNAMMVVQVKVLGSHDRRRGFMLQMQNLIHQIALVVVIDKTDDSEDFPFPLKLLMGRLMADHRAQRIRSVPVGTLSDQIVHQLKDVGLDRNAESL